MARTYRPRTYRGRRNNKYDGFGVLGFLIVLIWDGISHYPYIAIAIGLTVGILIANLVRSRRRQRQQLLEQIAKSGINEIDAMSGKQFEQRMAVYFQMVGYTVQTTPDSNDYGADLVLTTPFGKRIVAQCKRYSGTVGVNAVQEIIGAIPYYSANSGMVITNSHLTQNAKKLAKTACIIVWERETLIQKLFEAYEVFQRQSTQGTTQTHGQQNSQKRTQNSRQQTQDKQVHSAILEECFIVLGFTTTDITEKEIRTRFRELAKKTHPDAGGNHADFIRLQDAYQQCLACVSSTSTSP